MTIALQDSRSRGFLNTSLKPKFRHFDLGEDEQALVMKVPQFPESRFLNDYWKNSNSIYSTLKESLKFYSQHLKIENIDAIEEYLLNNRDRLEVFLNIIDKIIILTRKRFGNDTQILLKVNHDPEGYDDYLIFNLRKEEYPADFYDQIPELRNDYYAYIQKNKIWVLVTTDLLQPLK